MKLKDVMLKKFILFIFITFCKVAICQMPVHFVIGEKEFANTDIYTLFYDDNTDIIYAGTNNGLYAYKQNEFQLLAGPQDQTGISIFSIKRNNKGEIYCKNLNGQIFKVDEKNNSYETYYSLPENRMGHIWYFFTEKDDLLLITNYQVILNPQKENNVVLDCSIGKSRTIQNSRQVGKDVFIQLNNNESAEVLIYRFTNSKIELIDKLIEKSLLGNENAKLNYFSGLPGSTFYLNVGGNVVSPTDGIVSNYEPLRKERFYYVDDTTIIGLNSQNGFRSFQLKNDTLTTSPILFPKLFVSTFHVAKNGMYLLGTFGSGILVLPKPSIIRNKHDYLFLGIATSPNNKVALSTRSGELFIFENNKMRMFAKSSLNIDNVWNIGTYNGLKTEFEEGFLYDDSKWLFTGIKDVKVINQNMLIYASGSAIKLQIAKAADCPNNFNWIEKNENNYTIGKYEKFLGIEWSPNDSLFYYATNFGVYSREWSSGIVKEIVFKNKLFQANDLMIYKNDLVSGTTKYGVLFFKDDQVVKQISESNGLKSNSVEQIYIKDEMLFVLSKKGFQLYDLEMNEFLNIGISEGVKPEQVTRFTVSKDKIWFLEKHGYYDVNIDDLSRKNKESLMSKLFIDSICVNGRIVDANSISKFDYTQNRFEFYYDYREVITKQETEIFYTLEGFYDEWKSISVFENKIEFQSLPPGNYVFKIFAQRRSEKTKMYTYEFKISSPFWQTWWFYLSVGIIIILSITIYFSKRIKKIKENDLKELEKQKLLTETINFKLKALRSQMNPHFIFNSLNSIQALILKQETEKSYDYVVMFSDLVRKTLQYSDEDYIDVESELEFLETYLKLESLRMKNDFTFTIHYEGDTGVQIPSLMVQPFVENAIHHGLLHKDGPKNLSILFEFDTVMKCTVIDNGIGRIAASEINQRQNAKHKSFSLDATKQRMKIIEGKHGTNFGYKFYDLYKNEKSIGTKVVLLIPYKFKY